MHQRGGIQTALDVLVPQLPPREAAKVLVHERNQPLQSRVLTLLRRPQEPSDFADVGRIVHG